MSEPLVDLHFLAHWDNKGVLQSPCGDYLYINDCDCSLTFMVDNRVFVYLQDVGDTCEWSLVECLEDGSYADVSGTPGDEIMVELIKKDWSLFNPSSITLISKVPPELVKIVEYVKEYYL